MERGGALGCGRVGGRCVWLEGGVLDGEDEVTLFGGER